MEPGSKHNFSKRISNLVLWAVIIAIELWFLGGIYWPLFENAEVAGANVAQLFFMIIVAWVGYRISKSKKRIS